MYKQRRLSKVFMYKLGRLSKTVHVHAGLAQQGCLCTSRVGSTRLLMYKQGKLSKSVQI